MSTYGQIPIDLGTLKLTAVSDGMKDDVAVDGSKFSSYDVMRTHKDGETRTRIASVTVYENDFALILFGMFRRATQADLKAETALKAHLKARYEISNFSVPEYR